MSNLTAAQREELERRNLEHLPVWAMLVSVSDVEDLLKGIVNERVLMMATWLAETELEFYERLERQAAERQRPRRKARR